MKATKNLRCAWLFPSLDKGSYWHPIFALFTDKFNQTVIYTGVWPGYLKGFENTFKINIVGKTKTIKGKLTRTDDGQYFAYSSFILASPSIIFKLTSYRPRIIFTSGFSIWTIIAIILKIIFHWKVIILYDGSSPSIDYADSKYRLLIRKIIAKGSDSLVANSLGARNYMTEILQIKPDKICYFHYLVPDSKILTRNSKQNSPKKDIDKIRFVFVGEVIQRKGLRVLIDCLGEIYRQGQHNFSLDVIGDGSAREFLQALAKETGISNLICWHGWIKYEKLCHYIAATDVLVFPTFEDIWGMVVLEAMILGKPVLCSKWAGSSELITEGVNGYVFDPNQKDSLTKYLCQFINNPSLIEELGYEASQTALSYSPEKAVKEFEKLVHCLLKA
jgi:glycosyltransferase involved in cell wall biosynthesis